MSPSVETRRPENLALIFQEVLTAIVRLRANRHGITDAQAFRHHTREALKNAASQGMAAGYPADDVKLGTFAAVAFLDESVLNSQNPIFLDWVRKPLQEELFGTHLAGEVFFQNLQQLLGRADSADLADVLEVHYLCLLLGFGGRYSVGNRGELSHIMDLTAEKIRRIRGRFGPLSPAWMLPNETPPSRSDPWVKRLGIIAAVCAGLMVLLFVIYKVVLGSGVHVALNLPLPGGRHSQVAQTLVRPFGATVTPTNRSLTVAALFASTNAAPRPKQSRDREGAVGPDHGKRNGICETVYLAGSSCQGAPTARPL